MKAITIFALLLAGCASAQGPAVLSGTPHAVTIDIGSSTLGGATGALEAAEAHCQQYGKHAQFAGRLTDLQLAYNCA